MRHSKSSFCKTALLLIALTASLTAARAFQERQEQSRFDALAIGDPQAMVAPASMSLASLRPDDSLVQGWKAFRAAHGESWDVTLDARSGAPLLVEGEPIPGIVGWGGAAGSGPESLDELAVSLRAFLAGNASILLAKDEELRFNKGGSGSLSPEVWQVTFDRSVSGVPVAGIGTSLRRPGQSHGVRRSTLGVLPAARRPHHGRRGSSNLYAYMGLALPMPSVFRVKRSSSPATVSGQSRMRTRDRWEAATVASIWRSCSVGRRAGNLGRNRDARTGAVVGLYDDDKYVRRVAGGVLPVSNDGTCPDGCEKTTNSRLPLPFADVTIAGGAQVVTDSLGNYSGCSGFLGTLKKVTTKLAGPYVRILDTCGPVSESGLCGFGIDLQSSAVAGTTDCVSAGASRGDTHSARSSFYHLNRIAEHARTWLPTLYVPWLGEQLTANVDINAACNAYWHPSLRTVNFFKSGVECRNTGEIAGVFLHEWGHGLDQFDGGLGVDTPRRPMGTSLRSCRHTPPASGAGSSRRGTATATAPALA
jgi:hypothetical protein